MLQRIGGEPDSADTHSAHSTPALLRESGPTGGDTGVARAAKSGFVVARAQLAGLVKQAWLAERTRASNSSVSVPADFPVEAVAGVGPQRIERLHKAGITTFHELLTAIRSDSPPPGITRHLCSRVEQLASVLQRPHTGVASPPVDSGSNSPGTDLARSFSLLALQSRDASDERKQAHSTTDAEPALRSVADMNLHIVPRTSAECLSRRVGGCCSAVHPGASDLAAPPGSKRRTFEALLTSLGLREVETLNGIAPSGSCQFASVGEQLFGRPCDHTFRYDQLLRQAALAEIKRRAADFQPYLISARVRTRRQERVGGDAIDMDLYLRRMSSETCDGDHVTLQALSDVTGATINVVKWDGRADSPAVVLPPVQPHAHSSARMGTSPLQAALGCHLWLSLRGESHFRSLRSATQGVHASAKVTAASPCGAAKPSPSPSGGSPSDASPSGGSPTSERRYGLRQHSAACGAPSPRRGDPEQVL